MANGLTIPAKFTKQDENKGLLSHGTQSAEQPTAHQVKHTQWLCDAALKVILPPQIAVVVSVPYSVMWLTQREKRLLSQTASSLQEVEQALNQRMKKECATRVSSILWLSLQDGIGYLDGLQPFTHEDIVFENCKYKVDVDVYMEEVVELKTALALFTPILPDISEDSINAEHAQLSTIRYQFGGIPIAATATEGQPSILVDHFAPNALSYLQQSTPLQLDATIVPREISSRPVSSGTNSDTSLDTVNMPLAEFIPSLSPYELEYYYSIAPVHSTRQSSNLPSVTEIELGTVDPDTADPWRRHRQAQQMYQERLRSAHSKNSNRLASRWGLGQQNGGGLYADSGEILDLSSAVPNGAPGDSSVLGEKRGSQLKCVECGTEHSPEWRRGPLGPKTLCNRCGLRFAKRARAKQL